MSGDTADNSSGGKAPSPAASANPFAWINENVVKSFLAMRGVPLQCGECGNKKDFFIDTGYSDGMVPRSSAYSTNPDGSVKISDSRHMPVARILCLQCGHLRFFNLMIIDLHLRVKIKDIAEEEQRKAGPEGDDVTGP